MTPFARIAIACALILAVSGCASTQPRNDYQAYLRAMEAQQAQHNLAMAQLADASACNGDPTCVTAAKGFAALALAGGGNRAGNIAAPQRERSWIENAAMLANAVTPLAGIVANHYTARENARWNAENTRTLWEGIGALANGPYNALEAAIARETGDTTTINVGGNYGDTETTTYTTTNTDSFNDNSTRNRDSFNDNSDNRVDNSDNSDNSNNSVDNSVVNPVPVDPGGEVPVEPLEPGPDPIEQNPQSNWPPLCSVDSPNWPDCTPVFGPRPPGNG